METMPPISVLLIHKYRILADALSTVLRDRSGYSLAGIAEVPEQALIQLKSMDVDVVLFDIQSCQSPVRLVRELRVISSSMKILPMSVSPEKQIVELIEAGACGYVPITASIEELLQTVRQVYRNQAPCCPMVVAAVLDRLKELDGSGAVKRLDLNPARLTRQETSVLELLAEGYSNREVGRHLDISLSTVKMHVRSLLGKLQVDRRHDAVRVAAELGLLRNVNGSLRRLA